MFKCNDWNNQADILNRAGQTVADATNVIVSKTTLNRTEAFMKSVLSLEAPAEELSIENRHDGWGYHWYLPISETQRTQEKDSAIVKKMTEGTMKYELGMRLRLLEKKRTSYTASLLVFEQALTDYLSDAKVLFTVACHTTYTHGRSLG